MDTSSPQAPQPAGNSSGNSMMPIVLLILAVLVGVGAFLYYQNKGKAQTTVNVTNQVQPGSETSSSDQAPANDAVTKETTAGQDATTMETKTNNVKEFKVEGMPFSFTPSTMTVKKGDTVRIVFTNKEGFHDWVLDEFNARTKQIQAGQTDTIEFVADKAGEFEYYCSVGNHRAQGMVGTLTVTE